MVDDESGVGIAVYERSADAQVILVPPVIDIERNVRIDGLVT
ncbi:MAG: hypothetical protein ABSC06_09370 [Rhodopila sp.]|jgi:hypothetical protein